MYSMPSFLALLLHELHAMVDWTTQGKQILHVQQVRRYPHHAGRAKTRKTSSWRGAKKKKRYLGALQKKIPPFRITSHSTWCASPLDMGGNVTLCPDQGLQACGTRGINSTVPYIEQFCSTLGEPILKGIVAGVGICLPSHPWSSTHDEHATATRKSGEIHCVRGHLVHSTFRINICSTGEYRQRSRIVLACSRCKLPSKPVDILTMQPENDRYTALNAPQPCQQ